MLIVICGFAATLFGQKQFAGGFIITNEQDTIPGKIAMPVKPGSGKIKFKNETGKKKRYYPRQIKGFVINDTIVFESILQTGNADAAEYHVFAKVIKEGRFGLLATHNKTGSLLQQNNRDVNNYYVRDSLNGKFFKLTRMNYRRRLAGMISENKELKRELMNKVYDYEEIPEVIEKFNTWYSTLKK